MKVKTISRSSDSYVPVKNKQQSALPRNLDPNLHPFERAREYTKALTAAKMERMFAQPFIGQLGNGHVDVVYQIAKNFKSVNRLASGSGDGVVKYWNLTSREEEYSFKAHDGICTGLIVTPSQRMLSCGSDKTIKLWEVFEDRQERTDSADNDEGLLKTFLGEYSFQSLDHHREDSIFVTGGAVINLWDMNRNKPISDLSWGADNITTVKFNMTETSVIASAGSDNSIILYDVRTNSPTQKIKTTMRTNSICWNPMEAYIFASANEDHNSYLWDMRNMSRSINVYKDHVSAVMDVDFSPTGQEIVTSGYDKTIRIFGYRKGHSRDVYHTKRMQHVFVSKFSMDSKYIFSGSDEGNVRIWRTQASERSGIKSTRLRTKLEYDEKLKQRFGNMPEIKRISRHRHVPISVKKASEIKAIEVASLKRREMNERRHSKPGSKPFKSERQKHVVGQVHKA